RADLLRRRLARDAGRDDALLRDRDRRGARRNLNRRLERIALGRHDRTFGAEVKRPRPRVAALAARELQLEEAVAFDREVEWSARRPEVAAAEVARGRHRADAESHIEAHRRFAAGGG